MANPKKVELKTVAVTGVPRAAYSLHEFCAMVDISVSMYGKLRRQGLAPREIRLGRRVLISTEAMAEWRAEREEASTCKRA